MQTALVILIQTAVMFGYIAVGYLLSRRGKITDEGSGALANLLLWVALPSVLVSSFCREPDAGTSRALLVSALLAAVALGLSVAVSFLFFRKNGVDCFASTYSNAGFMGIPLVQASLGSGAALYLVFFVATVNIVQWTFGSATMSGKKPEVSLKKLACNPLLVSTLAGLVLFFTGWGARLPAFVKTVLSGLSALNAPVAMVLLGVYLVKTDLKRVFTTPALWLLSAVRLLLIPAVTLAAFALIPVSRDIRLALLISASAPVGSNVAVYAKIHGADYARACQTVAVTTLLSILSLPVVMYFAEIFI